MEKILLANRAFRFEITLRGYANAVRASGIMGTHGPNLHFYMMVQTLMIIKTALICTKIA